MKLKPCPFCGNKQPILQTITKPHPRHWVECMEMTCRAETMSKSNKRRAIEIWNRRVGTGGK